MIAVETNVLVYSHRREAAEHRRALECLRSLAAATEPWAIPWPCLYEFFSLVTNRRIWKDAASTHDQAWGQITAWLAAPGLRLLAETPDFADVLERFVRRLAACRRGRAARRSRSCRGAVTGRGEGV